MVRHRIMHKLRQARAAMLTLLLAVLVQGSPAAVHADDQPPLEVVASFSILGDMAKEIGGRHVNVVTVVGPNADAHAFEPTPQSVQALARAQVLISNGLHFETWLSRFIASSNFGGAHIVASEGATLRTLSGGDPRHGAHDRPYDGHHHGGVDPHAWQNLANGMVYARNIADGLSQADPERASHYQRRVKKYLATMEKLDIEVRAALDAIPTHHRKAVVTHDAFGYFGDAYGIEFIPLAALSDAAEPSAKDIAAVIDRVRQEEKVGVFPEKTSNAKLIEQLARETDAVVGEPLYADALDTSDEPAGTYLGMFHWNAGQLISVLKSRESTYSGPSSD